MQVCLHDQVPDLGLNRWQFRGIERLHLVVFVHELFELGNVVVHVGPHHGRYEVINDHGMGAALGLRALAGIVDDEGVDERQITQSKIGVTGRGEPDTLARQPFEGAGLA